MTVLWTAVEAAAATNGQATQPFAVTGISIDTRTLQKNDLFVALSAARDGHDFVAEALRKGAGAALVSRRPEGVAPDAPLLIVADVLEGLRALARAAKPALWALLGLLVKPLPKKCWRMFWAGRAWCMLLRKALTTTGVCRSPWRVCRNRRILL